MNKNPKNINKNKQEGVISYKGEVTIQYKDSNNKNVTIKKSNSGDLGLFSFLTRALQGLTNNSLSLLNQLKPSRINAFNGESDVLYGTINYESTPVLYNYVNNEYEINPTNSNTVEYTFRIPYNYLIHNEGNEKIIINKLYLLNNIDDNDENYSNICASVELKENQIEITTKTNILIKWKLRFYSDMNSDVTTELTQN